MAKYRVHLNTFKEAEDHWKSIAPVRGRVDDDVRPLGCRNRNYERIDRLNDNEYVLWSEWHNHWGNQNCHDCPFEWYVTLT